MLTYSPQQDSLPRPTEKPWLLLLLTFVWLWPGILGHDPWRPVEPYVNGVVTDMLAGGGWLIPSIHGEPYLDSPPLYYWVATLFARALSPWLLPLHDAARLATPFFMAIALAFAGCAGRELVGRRHGRSVVLVLIGSIGLIVTGHQMNPDVAAFAGYSLAFYALALALRAPGLAGALLAVGLVVTFLSSSLLEVSLILLVAFMLPAFAAWRSRQYAITLLLALLLAVPVCGLWPLLFLKADPAAFQVWWQNAALGPLSSLGHIELFHELGYYPTVVIWYAWPAWPLAAWTLYRNRSLEQPMLQLPLMFFGVILVLLALSNRQNPEYAMPLLLPMALLAAVELDSLKRGAAAFFNWFGLMTFGLFGLLIWVGWVAMNFGWPVKLAERAAYFNPFYHPQISLAATVAAVVASLVWLWAVTRRHLRGRQALTNWAAGVTLFWGLAMTLWLPWLDAGRSYQPVVENMMLVLPKKAKNCVAVERGDLLARLSWEYYAGFKLKPFEVGQAPPCGYWLDFRKMGVGVAEPGWRILWQGKRPRDKGELFVLLKRQPVK
jgi:4-amino-4-deoxy-L-arabinose transferase-like glycosyltransferase